MSLIPRLTQVYERLNRLPSKMGDPRYHAVSIVVGSQETQLSPNLQVIPIKPDAIGSYLSDTVQVMGDEWVINGIARTIPLETLQKAVWKIDGRKADLLYLDQRNPVTLRAIVRYRDSGK